LAKIILKKKIIIKKTKKKKKKSVLEKKKTCKKKGKQKPKKKNLWRGESTIAFPTHFRVLLNIVNFIYIKKIHKLN
jgi:hypothetical protein